jgi:hypothetical protein
LKLKVTECRSSTRNLESKKRKILLGRRIGPVLQETLGSKFEVCSTFKPNVPLAEVVEDWGKLALPTVIVGGPGNCLDRHYYAVEKDLIFIAERTMNTDVGFGNLLKKHNKP